MMTDKVLNLFENVLTTNWNLEIKFWGLVPQLDDSN